MNNPQFEKSSIDYRNNNITAKYTNRTYIAYIIHRHRNIIFNIYI